MDTHTDNEIYTPQSDVVVLWLQLCVGVQLRVLACAALTLRFRASGIAHVGSVAPLVSGRHVMCCGHPCGSSFVRRESSIVVLYRFWPGSPDVSFICSCTDVWRVSLAKVIRVNVEDVSVALTLPDQHPPSETPSRVAGSGSAAKLAAAPWPSPTATRSSSTSRGSTKARPLTPPAAITAAPKVSMPQGMASATKARAKEPRRPALVQLARGTSHTRRRHQWRLMPGP